MDFHPNPVSGTPEGHHLSMIVVVAPVVLGVLPPHNPLVVSLLAAADRCSIYTSIIVYLSCSIRTSGVEPILGNCNGVRGIGYTPFVKKTFLA